MTMHLTVPNMACSACGDTITNAVQGIDPTATVQADPKTKQVHIETQVSEAMVKQAIVTAGYQVEPSANTVTDAPVGDRAREELNQDLAQ